MIGDVIKQNSEISLYQPSQEIIDFTSLIRKDYSYGSEVLNRPWPELNNYSVIERKNIDQKTFNAFVDESTEDPNESWKWKGTRALARKKAFAMHAHMTSSFVVPMVFPQNSSQADDKAMAGGLRDILEWMTVNSNYRQAFLLATMGILVNPVTYIEADYCEVNQKIREKTEQGWQIKEALDEVLSGPVFRVRSSEEILLSNPFEQDIQKQRAVIFIRWVDYSELKAKYKDHENWNCLQPGKMTLFNDSDGLFYDVKDDEHPYLVKEVIWKNRQEDGEMVFLNGIYFGENNLEGNPIKHRDNRNLPKYNLTSFGYHRNSEHFFYFTSLMQEVGWDDRLVDEMYKTTMNREFLDLEQPTAYIGFDNIDTSVVFPGASISTQNTNAKVQPIINPRSGSSYRALQEIEDSMSEASLSETEMGVLPEASQKATAIAKASSSAKILLTGAMKNMGESIRQLGNLMIDISLNHLTAPEIDEITGNFKYREFILQNQSVNGRKVSKKIRFDESLMGKKISKQEKTRYEMKLLEEIGYPDNKESIIVLNPHLFSKMKYMAVIEADEMMVKNKEYHRQIMERLYTLLRQDPNIDAESLVRNLLFASVPQETEELMAKKGINTQNMVSQIMGKQTQSIPPMGINQNQMAGMIV